MSTSPTTPQTESKSPRSVLNPGPPAPDFTLRCTPDQTVSLNEVRGQLVVLAFYPADSSPVCGDQMALYNEMLDEFQEFQSDQVVEDQKFRPKKNGGGNQYANQTTS